MLNEDVCRMIAEYNHGISIAKIAEARGITPAYARKVMLLSHPALKRHKPQEPTSIGMIKYRQLEYENKKLREELARLVAQTNTCATDTKILIATECATADGIRESEEVR